MRFWDASAIVPLLVAQARSPVSKRLFKEDAAVGVWWGTSVECTSALARMVREDAIDRGDAADAFERLHAFEMEWAEVEPSVDVRLQAQQLLRSHPLRASDALQLASAMQLCRDVGESLPMVCYDRRLADAARAERITVIGADR